MKKKKNMKGVHYVGIKLEDDFMNELLIWFGILEATNCCMWGLCLYHIIQIRKRVRTKEEIEEMAIDAQGGGF